MNEHAMTPPLTLASTLLTLREGIAARRARLCKRRREVSPEAVEERNRYRLREEELDWAATMIDAALKQAEAEAALLAAVPQESEHYIRYKPCGCSTDYCPAHRVPPAPPSAPTTPQEKP